MKKMKTIKFPNTKEAYDIYDDEAVRSINGNKPDENGNVADVALKSDIERLTEEIDNLKENGGGSSLPETIRSVILPETTKEFQSAGQFQVSSFNGIATFERGKTYEVIFDGEMSRGIAGPSSKFGDGWYEIIFDSSESELEAPIVGMNLTTGEIQIGGGAYEGEHTVAIYRLNGIGAPSQQLVTNSDGNVTWEEKAFYKRIKATPVLDPTEYDVSAPDTGAWGPDGSYVREPSGEGEDYGLEHGQLYRIQVDNDIYDEVICDYMQYMGDYVSGELPDSGKQVMVSNIGFIVLTNYEPGVHTISIYKLDREIKPLPAEYIPELNYLIFKDIDGSGKRFKLGVSSVGIVTQEITE